MAARKRTSLRARASAATKSTPKTPAHLPLPEDIHLTHPEHVATESSDPRVEEQLLAETSLPDAEEWRLSKKDKRQVKRGLMLQRVREAGITKPSSSKQKTIKRKRRPGKKLKTDLDGLADALPTFDDENHDRHSGARGEEDEWEGISGDDEEMTASGLPAGLSQRRQRKRQRGQLQTQQDRRIIRLQSLPHRPGAMKRKRKLEGREMDRFARNLAQLADSSALRTERGVGVGIREGGGEGGGVSAGEKWAALRRFIGSTMETADGFEKNGLTT